jgi:hypothetical protein
MAEKTAYNESMVGTVNLPNYNDIIEPMNSSTMIFNICNDMARKIKDEAMDTIGCIVDSTP